MALTSGQIEFILGDWVMRSGDRLPMLGLALETDTGVPVDLTGAVCWLMLRHQDGLPVLTSNMDKFDKRGQWLLLPAYVYDPPNGIVVYDWPRPEAEALQVGVMDLMVEANLPNSGKVIAPSDRVARLVVRPTVALPVVGPVSP